MDVVVSEQRTSSLKTPMERAQEGLVIRTHSRSSHDPNCNVFSVDVLQEAFYKEENLKCQAQSLS